MTEPMPLEDHVLSIVIEAPVETVWEEITRTTGIQRPLYNTVLDVDLEPGGALRYRSPDGKRVFVIGKVVEVDAPRRLSHTYVFAPKPEPPTLVTWELEAVPEGCRVTLTHSGWTEAHEAPEKVAGGWREILGLLKQEIETGTIPLKTRVLYRLMGAAAFMLPKTSRPEEAEKLDVSLKERS